MNGSSLKARRASGKLLIIDGWGVFRCHLQKLQFCITFRTNTLPLITQTLSLNNDVCSRPMWQFRLCLSNTNKVDRKFSFVRLIGVFVQRVDMIVLFFPQL